MEGALESMSIITEEAILNALRSDNMTINEVAKQTRISRITASKYLAVLESKGIVKHRVIGKAKLYSLTRSEIR